ncbi:Rz1-like lysis system protein LysC [Volucribacter psittacicida]
MKIFKLLTALYQKSIVPLLACLLMLLNGCSNQTKITYLTPPTIYTLPCQRTPFTAQTYGEAITYLRMVMKERDMCANRVDKIREWIVEQAQR